MKWFERIAQGFNPGLRWVVGRALKVAPDVGRDEWNQQPDTLKTHLGRHFQGESCATRNPGLKPWAILFSPFGRFDWDIAAPDSTVRVLVIHT